ncbi:uncharacterized protein LOC135205299 [Macrobrachium nipponense]|uniref:uncharacterized protein LOC135205299 n=1 Tax=Macrobrachium nipponense TaxID=159736 RepID=UPI0030C81B9D
MAEHTWTSLLEGSGGVKVEEGEPDTLGESKVVLPEKLFVQDWRERVRGALKAVEKGMSLRQAASAHSVGRSTVSKYLRGAVDISLPRSRACLSPDIERGIVDWCLEMARIGHPQTKKSLPLVVQRILNKKKKKVFGKNNLPSHGWVCRFMGRHPELSNRIPENQVRLKGTITPKTISTFFKNLQALLVAEDINVSEFLSPDNASRVFVCDETGIFVSAQDGAFDVLVKKHVQSTILSGEGKPMVSVLCCASADGSLMRPFIVNKGKTPMVYGKHQDLEADSYRAGCSDSGSVTADLFDDWLGNVFEKELVKKNIEKPVLLILDGHSTPLNMETLRFARDKKILMYCLPPHSSHIMQPFHVSVFRPLMAEYRKAYNEVWGEFAANEMPKKYFPIVLMKAIKEGNIIENIKSGFRTTGLVPFNPNAIKLSRFIKAAKQENPSPVHFRRPLQLHQ